MSNSYHNHIASKINIVDRTTFDTAHFDHRKSQELVVRGLPLGKPSIYKNKNKVTKLWTLSVPPLAPRPPGIYGHLGGCFYRYIGRFDLKFAALSLI